MQAFQKQFVEKASLLADRRFDCLWSERLPCLNEAGPTTSFDAHYVYHTAWAARILGELKPKKHVDIGSCLRFVSLVSAFIPIDFYDYRPPHLTLSNLWCGRGDLLRLPFGENAIHSLSCMHVVEHIGLERYGDPFLSDGDLLAIEELIRVLAYGGTLLFVVPVGERARIQYNAHRIYTYQQILGYFAGLQLISFAFINDRSEFIECAEERDIQGNIYGCGCFYFKKIPSS